LLPLLRAAPSVLTLAARLGGKVRALDTKSGRERARPRSMVTAAAPRLGDKEA
jgi:hypothetical protein